jgi:hypothetical protein
MAAWVNRSNRCPIGGFPCKSKKNKPQIGKKPENPAFFAVFH